MDLPQIIILSIVGGIAVILLLYLLIALLLEVMVTHPKRYETNFTNKVDVDKGLIGYFNDIKREPYEIKLSDGYVIHSDYINNNNSKKFVIIVHGYTWTKEGSLKYAKLFYELGYSIVFYDTRGHGLNKHGKVMMGYLEKKDLHEIIQDTYKRFGNDIFLGLHGESLGAATTLLSCEYKDKIDFIVSDCAFADLGYLLEYQAKKNHIWKIFLNQSFKFFKLNNGYNPREIRPVDAIKDNEVPLLIIHGESDTFIPCEHAMMINDNAVNCYKELHLIKGAEHSSSIIVDTENYKDILKSFLSKVESGGYRNGKK